MTAFSTLQKPWLLFNRNQSFGRTWNMKRTVEILAPAGSWECMEAAVCAGADAVYMGGSRFGARAYAENPEQEQLLQAIDYVHLHGRKIYLTVNTLLKDVELDELYDEYTGDSNRYIRGQIFWKAWSTTNCSGKRTFSF